MGTKMAAGLDREIELLKTELATAKRACERAEEAERQLLRENAAKVDEMETMRREVEVLGAEVDTVGRARDAAEARVARELQECEVAKEDSRRDVLQVTERGWRHE